MTMSLLDDVLLGDDVSVLGWGEAPPWGEHSMVLSPTSGRWHPEPGDRTVSAGDVLGEVRQGGRTVEVVSPSHGRVTDVLELDGHPVERGRPLVWLETLG